MHLHLTSTGCPVCSLNSISNHLPGWETTFSVCMCVYGGLTASNCCQTMGHRGPCVCGTRNRSEWGYVSQCAIPSDYQAKPASKQVKWPGSQVCISLWVTPLEELATRVSRPNSGKPIRSQAQLRDLFPCACECLCRRQLGRARIHGQPLDSPSAHAQLLVGSALYYYPLKGLLPDQPVSAEHFSDCWSMWPAAFICMCCIHVCVCIPDGGHALSPATG